jgi:hypothetical protein
MISSSSCEKVASIRIRIFPKIKRITGSKKYYLYFFPYLYPMKLTIPTPCSENWDAITPTACGRFCTVCQKEVIDVTQMEETAILQKYEQNGGELCIRARAEQISPVVRVRSFPMQRLAVFALAVWLVFAGGLVSEVQGQVDSVKTDISASDTNDCVLMVRVLDTQNRPVDSLKVKMIRQQDSSLYQGYTDKAGICIFKELPVGDYLILLRKKGYLYYRWGHVTVCNNQVNQVTFCAYEDYKEGLTVGALRVQTKMTMPALDTRRFSNRVFGNNGQVDLQYYQIW